MAQGAFMPTTRNQKRKGSEVRCPVQSQSMEVGLVVDELGGWERFTLVRAWGCYAVISERGGGAAAKNSKAYMHA